MKRLILILIFLAPAGLRAQTTYYIDYAAGSNSNSGTSTASPWKTHPYMNHSSACDGGSGPSYPTHHAGDQFIFKGGSSWPVACFPLIITAGGTSSAQDYYGVCKAGDPYSPSACGGVSWPSSGWARPLFDQTQHATSSNRVISTGSNLDFITIDNFEIANQLIILTCDTGTSCQSLNNNGTPAFQSQAIYFQNTNGGSPTGAMNKTIVANVYIHDWVTQHTGGCLGSVHYATGSIRGASLVDSVEVSGEGSWYIDSSHPLYFGGGIDSGLTSGTSAYELKNSKIHGGMAGAFSYRSVHDNEIYHESSEHGALDSCPHSQVIENDDGGVEIIYNNLVHDNQGRGGQNVGVVLYEGPYSQIYNNVFYHNNISGFNADMVISEGNNGSQPSAIQNTYNNTVDCSNGVPCWATDSKATIAGTVNLKNNIWITNGNALSIVSSIATFINSSNTSPPMSTTEATTYGYIVANKYKPTSSDPNTVAKGANLTTSCTGNLAQLCSDTQSAPWFGGTAVLRPTGSTGWDLGAYQSTAGSPPTVTVTSPAAGTVSGTVNITITASGGTISSIQPLVDGAPFGGVCTSSPCNATWNTALVGNGTHTVGATATNGTGQGSATPVTVTVNNVAPGCTVSGSSWTATAFTAQTGSFTATLNVTPNGVPSAGSGGPIVGLSQAAATSYPSNSTLIRQSDNGFWEVYSGSAGGYVHSASVSWIVGTQASFTWTVNVALQLASVSVTQNGVTSTLATGVTFRASASSLGFWNLDPETPPTTLTVCNFALGATGALTPTSFNYGNINVGSTTSQVFTLTNNGASPLSISGYTVTPSVFTISSNSCVSPLATGSSCSITVQFAPTASQVYSGTLSVSTTGTVNSVTLSGTGVSASIPGPPTNLTASPAGSSVSLTWTASIGTPPITYTVLRGNQNGGPYAQIASGVTASSYTDGGLPPATYYYVVTATNSIGTSGNSNQAVAVISGTAQMSLSSTSLNFGNVALGNSASLNITVSNIGTASFTLDATAALPPPTGTNAADFSTGTSSCFNGLVIAPGGACSFLVTFIPSVAGIETASQNIVSNAPGSPAVISLTGTGFAGITATPASVNFGAQVLKKPTPPIAVTLSNQSGVTITIGTIALVTGTQFAISGNTCGSAGSTLASGLTCAVSVICTPTSAGGKSDTLTIPWTGFSGSPISVPLSCTGRKHVVLPVGAVVNYRHPPGMDRINDL